MNVIVEFEDETYVQRRGVVMNSQWSDAHGTFFVLLSCEDGPFRTIRSDLLGAQTHWIEDDPAVIMVEGGSDDDDDDSEDDE